MMATMRSAWARRPSMPAIALFAGMSLFFVASDATQTLGAVSGKISFQRDVLPILQKNCVACHRTGGVGHYQTGLDLTSYAGVMKGSRWGSLVVAGNAASSNLMRILDWEVDPRLRMPPSGHQLSLSGRNAIRAWIDAGAENN